ncbi:glutamine synthetase catalytic domain protein [Peptoanaerobacter stomatis]|uniref:glutamine synthetase n=1 Tax=Peptoanaerobacter stomatis TaxID=796937 RepID=J5WLP3_9FIRM|nr:glutamine synthetase [Peptoanaerobacter stomatis]EJU22877.1 glutamine synthetase catalytic domain protein [Peptoanaerobacter stomatis]NWO25541.1 glutamine synthetase [Peptostreptococcaceae bacterium oral taxon 081]
MNAINLLKENNLLFTLKKDYHSIEDLKKIFEEHKEIKFVSLAGYDLRGNYTDARIPISIIIYDLEDFLKQGVQTDGSSVELRQIASLNDAKVIIVPDMDCDWHVDYNFSFVDENTKLPVGTLRIPSFLIHNDKIVCSRGILKRAVKNLQNNVKKIVEENESIKEELGIKDKKIKSIEISAATELEFWVKTPEEIRDVEELSTSQVLKEQYWKRTEGNVRTAMEYCLLLMDKYGFEPEMGHKEVGGVHSKLTENGDHSHIMEQLEIDWKYSDPIQTADNLYIIKNLVSDIFNSFGLEVTFDAKPMDKVAGSGEHTHIGLIAKLDDGKAINIFNHVEKDKYYMSSIGFSSLAGILRNYEVINPFVTATTDAFNRLRPGFEAPVCIVTSLGKSPQIPSRNRSILIGLIKDSNNPKQTRFELRATNPNSNLYLVLSAVYQCMLDAINFYIPKYDVAFIQNEMSKKAGEDSVYLEKDRLYRSEENVFEAYTQEERNAIFSIPPATVYENIQALDIYKEKLEILKKDGVFTDEIINSYKISTLEFWAKELKGRIVENSRDRVRESIKLHYDTEDISDLDIVNWTKVESIRWELMKDTVEKKSLFTQIDNAIDEKDYKKASTLQIEMSKKVNELAEIYKKYKKNIF